MTREELIQIITVCGNALLSDDAKRFTPIEDVIHAIDYRGLDMFLRETTCGNSEIAEFHNYTRDAITRHLRTIAAQAYDEKYQYVDKLKMEFPNG